MNRKIVGLIGACVFAGLSVASADEEVPIQLKGIEDYGSGPSVMDDRYTPGGLEQVGLFVGNPNSLPRKDRALFKYDLKPLLLSASRIKSAVLDFHVEYLIGPEEMREMRIKHLNNPVATFAGTDINSPDAEEIAVVEISIDELINGKNGVAAVPPKEVDVTSALKKSLDRGDTSCAFRFEDVRVESSAAAIEPAGIIISRPEGKRPVLRVFLND